MNKNYLLIFSLMALGACSKSDKGGNPSGGTGLTATISTQMAKTDSLGSFSKYFKAAALSDAEVSGGITVFAPSNNAFGNAAVSGTGALPDGSVSKDYIVKGVLKASDLTAGKTLTTLSGKTLTVSIVADPIILVGGMIINENALSTGDNYAVFGAAQLLNAPAPVFVTVWDATKWSSQKPKGEPSVGAAVKLYKSQESFAADAPADYTGTTDKDGVAQINGVQEGTYYVVAYKGDISNIFNVYTETVNNVYLGYAADTVLDNAGNLKWLDLNQDGIVTSGDLGAQPALSIVAKKFKPVDVTVLMGYLYKPVTTITGVQQALDGVNSGLSTFYQNLVIMDGTLSDDAGCGAVTTFCPLDNFSITSNMTLFNSIWTDAYFKGVHKLNKVAADASVLAAPDDQVMDLIYQATVTRDYIYLELATYFGDIPSSSNDLSPGFYPGISRKAYATLLAESATNLTDAALHLPVTRASGKAAITQFAAVAIHAKLALLQKQYATVRELTSSIIKSGQFSLSPAGYSWVTSQNTSETIWAPAFSNIGSTAVWYFDGVFGGTQPQYIPVLRYADVLLMDAEAKIALEDLTAAATDINLLRARGGQDAVSFSNQADGYAALQAVWQTEKYRQGDRYANLLRWNTVGQTLSASGWHQYNNLMPVPQNFLESYPGLVQNPGY
jgi:hypothetical protein